MKDIYNHKFTIINIKKQYLEYLHMYDSKVLIEHPNSKHRPYIGIAFILDKFLYFIPLSSPKEKHVNMKNKIDFYKIKNGKLGALNFNNMIPITQESIIIYDIKNETDIKYKFLLNSQLRQLERKNNAIKRKAFRLYDKYNKNELDSSTRNRCCNFKLLEEKAKLYTNQ